MKSKKVESKEKKTWWNFLELHTPQSRPDVTVSLLMMFAYGCFSASDPLRALSALVQNYDKATSLDYMVKAMCGFFLHSFIIFSWFAKAFGGAKSESSILQGTKSSFFHKLLSRGVMGHNFMPGGFAPRWFALSIGGLLFVNKIFLTSVMIKGSTFNSPQPGDPALIHKWPGGLGCYANSAATGPVWFARFWRKGPAGCYMTAAGESSTFYLRPDGTVPNLLHPFQDGTDTIDTTHNCMYQCVAWQSLAVQTVLLSSGVIVAGGVFIERLTNAITTACGYGFINTTSKEADLSKALDTLLKKPSTFLIGWKRTIFVIVLMSIELFVHTYAALVDKDGGFTVDYYITSAFMLSVLLALLFRNVETMSRVQPIYTQKLWSNGEETFQSRDAGKKLRIDLYEWSHLPGVSRAQLLLDYARTIELKDCDEFDLDEFMTGAEQGTRQAEPAQAIAQGSTQDRLHSVRQRLLDVDTRLSLCENGSDEPPTTQHNDETVVRCIRHHVSFTDIFVFVLHDGKRAWVPLRVQVRTDAKATGKVLGRTMQGTVMVQWDNNEFLSCFLAGNDTERIKTSPYIVTDIKLTHIVEYTEGWHNLQKRIHKSEKEIEAQKAIEAQNTLVTV